MLLSFKVYHIDDAKHYMFNPLEVSEDGTLKVRGLTQSDGTNPCTCSKCPSTGLIL